MSAQHCAQHSALAQPPHTEGAYHDLCHPACVLVRDAARCQPAQAAPHLGCVPPAAGRAACLRHLDLRQGLALRCVLQHGLTALMLDVDLALVLLELCLAPLG